MYGRHEADLKRFFESPPFVAIAVETNISVELMLARLAVCEQVASSDAIGEPQDPMDAVFLIDRGVVLNLGTGQEQDKVLDPDGVPVPGWVFFETATVLAEMMIWLHRTMPRFSMPSYASTPRVRH